MKKNQTITIISILLLLSALLSITGALFKLQHYPYGAELLNTSGVFWIISIGLIIVTSVQGKKKSKDN